MSLVFVGQTDISLLDLVVVELFFQAVIVDRHRHFQLVYVDQLLLELLTNFLLFDLAFVLEYRVDELLATLLLGQGVLPFCLLSSAVFNLLPKVVHCLLCLRVTAKLGGSGPSLPDVDRIAGPNCSQFQTRLR